MNHKFVRNECGVRICAVCGYVHGQVKYRPCTGMKSKLEATKDYYRMEILQAISKMTKAELARIYTTIKK